MSNGAIVYKYTYCSSFHSLQVNERENKTRDKSRFHLEVKSFKLSAYQDFPLGREVRHNKEGVFFQVRVKGYKTTAINII